LFDDSYWLNDWAFLIAADLLAHVGVLSDDIGSTIVSNVPSILYSLLIIIYNAVYLKLARRLTIWENHR
jgi:Calcium-activated chloride channel